jgi:hydrogenase expression/formation protein HypC
VCLAIPGRVLEVKDLDGLRHGKVQFGGIVRNVRLDFVPEADTGDYVMVHVGFAISRVDVREAKRTYEILQAMGTLAEELGPGEDLVSDRQSQ